MRLPTWGNPTWSSRCWLELVALRSSPFQMNKIVDLGYDLGRLVIGCCLVLVLFAPVDLQRIIEHAAERARLLLLLPERHAHDVAHQVEGALGAGLAQPHLRVTTSGPLPGG